MLITQVIQILGKKILACASSSNLARARANDIRGYCCTILTALPVVEGCKIIEGPELSTFHLNVADGDYSIQCTTTYGMYLSFQLAVQSSKFSSNSQEVRETSGVDLRKLIAHQLRLNQHFFFSWVLIIIQK